MARVRAAPRLASLAGRTIGEFWNGVFKGDVTFPLIRERLQARFPDIRIVPFTEFPHAAGSDDPAQQKRHAARLAAMAKAKGCEALISGNGA